MRSEHERNMNVLRGLLQACEEGATEELCDGSNGDEPWTEEDRRASRASANWIRSTFFSAPKPPTREKPKIRTPKGEQLFSDELLWAQLEGTDPERRTCAVAAIDALAKLASVRAKKRGTSFLVERSSIFDVALLLADLRCTDRELHDAAFRVWDEVSFLAALLDAETIELTDEDREQARKLREWALAKLEELRRAAEERDEGGAP